MRSSRFQSFQPLRTPSLRRLKTAFSSGPTSASPLSSTSSASSIRTTSPLTRTSSPDSSYSPSSLRVLLLLRRKPSTLDIEMEEERRSFGVELAMLEPRPQVGVAAGGIFEVLDGRI
ncbi:hypothetical protein K432DRAFT_202480 [Lepidopterella palustris CBS 459.81]|uniref:Uncharacterized protein n=1 Tax=Lepidopterella palustris CBS 459.81 TaxID=1314670 RepID=A0A8E2EL50_9PEZI|nr:hypothetical protein K432DRAFT_202480 [Lepidopterella palustris CBS 459.81]